MTIKSPVVGLLVALLFGFGSACGPSKSDLQKVQKELKEVTADRDELRVKLEKTLVPLENLRHENLELHAKVDAAAAERDAAAKPDGASPSKKKATAKKKKKKKKKAKK